MKEKQKQKTYARFAGARVTDADKLSDIVPWL
jgi:hypothetical protein